MHSLYAQSICTVHLFLDIIWKKKMALAKEFPQPTTLKEKKIYREEEFLDLWIFINVLIKSSC